jgi:prepilin-type N-terminal cleavage/methylation domain-containing protein/prepilin-type processing-associated H-X9-DG protein
MKLNRRGFTLIELLLAVAIISLILMLIVPALVAVRRQALILSCQNNMRQITELVLPWIHEHNDMVPYLLGESMLDPEHREALESEPSILAEIVGSQNRGILKCPADTGYGGIDYGLTAEGVTCYAQLGQSYTYNNARPDEYEGRPVSYALIDDHSYEIIMLSDLSSVWHGSRGSDTKSVKYFLNFAYFDGHAEGKEFDSDEEAKRFRNDQSRWW